MKRYLLLAALITATAAHAQYSNEHIGSPYGVNRYGSSPPSSFTYGFSAPISLGNANLGDIDSAEFGGVYVAQIPVRDRYDFLGGVSLRRFQFGTPAGSPLPNTLQSVAGVVGAQGRFGDSWRARIEALPGIYSDFSDISGEDITSPVVLEGAYLVHDDLEIGAQLMLNPFRSSKVIGTLGVTWLIDDYWKLEFWLPRPQIEYSISEDLTLFAGGSLGGGSFRVAEDFGDSVGRPNLNSELVDFREIRAGAGARFNVGGSITAELAAGWIFDRRFEFHRRDLTANGDGAPYVQFSLGARF
ncbi:MAG: hypothetical protein CMO80_04785 [Verrucomicrobiales bacterium]|nr:hypothetical protein [Verrucomicrobiales bacterium]|tara:strand:- start:1619 stop:2518 length:900 start_codon:yes stop_codon:yes gene_type:complete